MARVLVVDDSPTMLNATAKILQSGGHEVITAESGEEGVEKTISEHPDVVIMDIVMPGMNGFQATRKITKHPETKDIPVIMCTTKDLETDKVWAERQGATDYIVKPPEKEHLLEKVDAVIAN